MGWQNYIVLDKFKVYFPINRGFDTETIDWMNKNMDLMISLIDDIEKTEETEDKGDLVNLSRLIIISNKCQNIFDEGFEYVPFFLARWLMEEKIEFRIVYGGNGLPEDIKDYLCIGRNYGED